MLTNLPRTSAAYQTAFRTGPVYAWVVRGRSTPASNRYVSCSITKPVVCPLVEGPSPLDGVDWILATDLRSREEIEARFETEVLLSTPRIIENDAEGDIDDFGMFYKLGSVNQLWGREKIICLFCSPKAGSQR